MCLSVLKKFQRFNKYSLQNEVSVLSKPNIEKLKPIIIHNEETKNSQEKLNASLDEIKGLEFEEIVHHNQCETKEQDNTLKQEDEEDNFTLL